MAVSKGLLNPGEGLGPGPPRGKLPASHPHPGSNGSGSVAWNTAKSSSFAAFQAVCVPPTSLEEPGGATWNAANSLGFMALLASALLE